MSCVCMLRRGHNGDGCNLASALCKYDLREGDLFDGPILSTEETRTLLYNLCLENNRGLSTNFF